MKNNIESLLKEILVLPKEMRAFMAEKILESLESDSDIDISDEWLDEIKRRKREIEDGTALLVPMDEVFEKVLKSIS